MIPLSHYTYVEGVAETITRRRRKITIRKGGRFGFLSTKSFYYICFFMYIRGVFVIEREYLHKI